jgi:hypothetical protein
VEDRPEYRFLGLFVPWIFVVSLAGFLTALDSGMGDYRQVTSINKVEGRLPVLLVL